MNPLMPQSRRAEAFAVALDGSGPVSHSTEDLVDLVGALRTLEPIEPALSFTRSLRAQLMTAAESELVAVPALPRQRDGGRSTGPVRAKHPAGHRRIVVAATALVMAGGGLGLAGAGASALPGDLLYPVKRGTEQVDLAIHVGPASDGTIRLEQASTRLTEVQGLLATRVDDPRSNDYVGQALQDFTEAADLGGILLISSYEQDSDVQSLQTLQDFLATSSRTLATLADAVPASAAGELAAAARLVGSLDDRAEETCPSCGFGNVSTTLQAVVDNADRIVVSGKGLPPGSVTKVHKRSASEPESDTPPTVGASQKQTTPSDEPSEDEPRVQVTIPTIDSNNPTQGPPTEKPDDGGSLLPTDDVTVSVPNPLGDGDQGPSSNTSGPVPVVDPEAPLPTPTVPGVDLP